MTEETENLVLHHLQAIREEQAVASKKTAVMADGMVAMRRDMHIMQEKIDTLTGSMQMIAIAVDGHNERLAGLETHLERVESRLDRIESYIHASGRA